MVVVDKVDKGEKKMMKTYDELKAELMQMVVDQHNENMLWAKDNRGIQKKSYELHIGEVVVKVTNETK